MPKLNPSKSQIIEDNMILNSFNEFVLKEPESIKPIESPNENKTYYPKRSKQPFTLSKLGYKPYIDYDQNLTFENAIDQIFEGLNQADIDEIKNHTKWNQNFSNAGLPKEKCLKNLRILAEIIKKKKANSPESTKAIQEGVMSNVQDFLNDDGCYANLIARLESYRITNLESLVISNALYQYILASGGLLTHFHDRPSDYIGLPFKKSPINSPINSIANYNIDEFEMDHSDIPNHDVKYFDEYIEFMHNSMKSFASGVTSEEMKDFILKNLATKLGYQDAQYYKSLEPDSDIKDLVDKYDKDLAKYNKNLDKTFEPKIPEDDQAILGLIKDAIALFEQKKNIFLYKQRPNKNITREPLIEDCLNKAYLLDLVNRNTDLDANAKNELKAKIENLNLQAIISEYSQYKISKTKPDIALICKKKSKEDLAYKAEKYIKYRDEFPEKQRKEKEEVLKNLAESGYLDDISNAQERENELTNYIPSKKLLNCVLNPDQSSKDINDYVNAFIPTLHLFDNDKKSRYQSRDQQEENNTLLNDVNFQPPERRIGDKEWMIRFIAFVVALVFMLEGFFLGSVVLASPLIASISFGVGAIGLAGALFVGVNTFLKNRSNNRFNALSPSINYRLKNEIKRKVASAKDLASFVNDKDRWNEFIKPSTDLQNEINEIKRLYNINIDDLYNDKLKSIRQSLINRFVIHYMVAQRIGHPIKPKKKVSLDNLDPSVNDINEDSNLDFTEKDYLVPKYETVSHNIFEESDSHDDDSIYSKDIILPDIVVEDLTKNPSSQRTIQSAKSSLRKNEPNFTNLNHAEKLPHEIKITWNENLYKRLAKNQIKVQNYINNENPSLIMDQGLTRKNQKTRIHRNNIAKDILSEKLSEKQRFLINMYGDQKTPLPAQYRDLMPIRKKTELASDNPRSKGMIKR